jgi:hypothetical protein
LRWQQIQYAVTFFNRNVTKTRRFRAKNAETFGAAVIVWQDIDGVG